MNNSPSGPIRSLIKPRNSREARIRGRIGRDCTDPDWIPAGLSPELDALREKQAAHIEQMTSAIEDHDKLTAQYNSEEETYTRHLEGVFADNEDARDFEKTPDAERKAALNDLATRQWAAAALLADVCDDIVETLQTQEAGILGQLESVCDAAKAEHRELMAQANEKLKAIWHLPRLGRWIQQVADDGPFSRSKLDPAEPPAKGSFSDDRGAFERHWSKQGPRPERRAPMTNSVRFVPRGDQTGVVLPLDDDDQTGTVGPLPAGDQTGVVIPLDD